MKYRKKPVVIEAIPITKVLRQAEHAWDELPQWIRDAYEAGSIIFGEHEIYIKTLEGTMTGEFRDMLIRGVEGELYPIKSGIFKATYEPVTEEEST